MSIIESSDGDDAITLAEYEFGDKAGTSPYYEIPSGNKYPLFYYDVNDDEENGYYYALDSHSYNFLAGKKYTFTCGDDGEFLTFAILLDGNAKAPTKVVASGRIAKSELKKLRRVHNK